MNELDFYKTLSLVSPFVSAFLAALLSYAFSIKSKKFDILYQNKVPAFKEMTSILIELKKICLGRIAEIQGNEFSPYWETDLKAFETRAKIANILESNSIFLSFQSRKIIENLIDRMSNLCNAEAILIENPNDIRGLVPEYIAIADFSEDCIKELYNDLNLSSFKVLKPNLNFRKSKNYR